VKLLNRIIEKDKLLLLCNDDDDSQYFFFFRCYKKWLVVESFFRSTGGSH